MERISRKSKDDCISQKYYSNGWSDDIIIILRKIIQKFQKPQNYSHEIIIFQK